MNPTNKSRKLSLSTTTVRALSADQLGLAAGGAKTAGSERCGSGIPGCSARCDSEAHPTCGQSNWASKCTY